MSDAARQDRFLGLLDEHGGILHKVASAYAWNPADREDLVQEIVAQLWRSFGRYDERFKFSTWMYRVALNVAISFSRGESRRTRRTVPVAEEHLEIAAPVSAGRRGEDLEVLHRVIAQLGGLDRALVVLYLDGNRYDTIAEVLGISETNVATKLSRLKQRLRRDVAIATH
jgi:RNA polymerase sigma-70 factor (ECF subfamily)